MSLVRLRERLPLIVLLLLALLFFAIGCLCLSDHPAQALTRVIDAISSMPAVVEMGRPLAAALSLVPAVFLTRRLPALSLSSPAALQRFLF